MIQILVLLSIGFCKHHVLRAIAGPAQHHWMKTCAISPNSKTLTDAVNKLLRRFRHEDPMTTEDFLRDYGDSRFGRFMLYLLVYRNKALDWDEHSHRLGFEGLEALADFRPQWHHIFPKKYLEGKDFNGTTDALGNIAVIGPSINIRISAKAPLDYVKKYKITTEKLQQQFIDPDFVNQPVSNFDNWAQKRAEKLAKEANAFLAELRKPI